MALYCIALYGIVLHCIVLHCMALYCIVLYSIVSQYNASSSLLQQKNHIQHEKRCFMVLRPGECYIVAVVNVIVAVIALKYFWSLTSSLFLLLFNIDIIIDVIML